MNSHGFTLPNTDTNSTIFDFLVIFCSFCVYSLVPGRVDVPFTRYAPHRSGRAAFPHPALHMANRMSDLCVSDTFLLEISFLVMPISVYWTSFFSRILPHVVSFPPVALPTFNGTMELSDYLYFFCLSFIDKTYSAPFSKAEKI